MHVLPDTAHFCQAFYDATREKDVAQAAEIVRQGRGLPAATVDELPPGFAIADAWVGWLESGMPDTDTLCEITARVFANLPLDQELSLVETLVAGDKQAHAHALAKWCALYPGGWERVHAHALGNPSAPRAFMLACSHAATYGLASPAWQALACAPSTKHWLEHVGWIKDRPASAISSWWARKITTLDEPVSEAFLAELCKDPITQALSSMGAPWPGSASDRAMGGSSVLGTLVVPPAGGEFFKTHEDIAYPHPQTGSTPLFRAKSHAEVIAWMSCGLDPRAINAQGRNALTSSLWQWRSPVTAAFSWLAWGFESGELPTTGVSIHGSLVEWVFRNGPASLKEAWLHARIKEATAFCADEVYWAGKMADPFELLGLVKSLAARGELNSDLRVGVWQSAIFRDHKEDQDAWDEISRLCPFHETAQQPLWVSLLEQWDRNELAVGLRQACHIVLDKSKLPPSIGHAVWDNKELVCAWVDCLAVMDQGLGRWVPLDATPEWWAQTLGSWLGARNIRQEQDIQLWLSAGLPVETSIVRAMILKMQSQDQEKQLQSGEVPWWEHPRISTVLTREDLNASTLASSTPGRARRM